MSNGKNIYDLDKIVGSVLESQREFEDANDIKGGGGIYKSTEEVEMPPKNTKLKKIPDKAPFKGAKATTMRTLQKNYDELPREEWHTLVNKDGIRYVSKEDNKLKPFCTIVENKLNDKKIRFFRVRSWNGFRLRVYNINVNSISIIYKKRVTGEMLRTKEKPPAGGYPNDQNNQDQQKKSENNEEKSELSKLGDKLLFGASEPQLNNRIKKLESRMSKIESDLIKIFKLVKKLWQQNNNK